MPQVSVVLPFRNARRYLADALESVLAQDFRDFELLAVNDGSDDGSVELARSFAARDPRVRILSADGRGLPTALNVGIAASQGAYVARMDGDDLAFRERFSHQVAVLDAHPRVLVVGSAVDNIDSAGQVVDIGWFPSLPESIRASLESGKCCLCHPATMIRRDALVSVGGYRTSVPLTEDFDLWLRLSRIGDLVNLDRRLLGYRLHAGSVAFHRTLEQVTSLLRSAVLNRAELDERERAHVSRSGDLEELIARLHPDQDPVEVFLRMNKWYVENAVIAGEARAARRLARQLATLSPGDRDLVRRRLRQAGALVASNRGWRFLALRLLMGKGAAFQDWLTLWRSVAQPPRLSVLASDPEHSIPFGGYLDHISLYEGGARVLLYGWLPVTNGRLPTEVGVVFTRHVQTSSLRLMQRLDVGRVMGLDHLHSGFRIELLLDQPFTLDQERPRVWSRAFQQPWRRVNDDGVRLDAVRFG